MDEEEIRKAKEVLKQVIKEEKNAVRGKTYTLKISIDESTRRKLFMNAKELGTTIEEVAAFYVINGDEGGLEELVGNLDTFNNIIKDTLETNTVAIREIKKNNTLLNKFRNRPQKVLGKLILPEDIKEISEKHFEQMWKGANIEQMSKEQREHYYGLYIDKILDEYILKELSKGNSFIFKDRIRYLLVWECVKFVREKLIEKGVNVDGN